MSKRVNIVKGERVNLVVKGLKMVDRASRLRSFENHPAGVGGAAGWFFYNIVGEEVM
jgi:hypothetical protein